MSVRLSLPAPAKLNLFLHILGRRDDGYHELQTLFHSSTTATSCISKPARTVRYACTRKSPGCRTTAT